MPNTNKKNKKNTNSKLLDMFNASIMFDKKLYSQDIKGSIAHSKMLALQNIITNDEQKSIEKGLLQVLEEIKNKAKEIVAQYNQMPDIKKQITTLFAVNPQFQTRDKVSDHNAKHGEIGLYFKTESECAIAKSVLSKYITQSKEKSVTLTWSPDLVAALSDKNLSQRVQDAKAEINNIFTPASPKR